MLSTKLTQYMQPVGLVLLTLALVFGIISAVDSDSTSQSLQQGRTARTFFTLFNVCSIVGGFLLVSGSVSR